jgi:hypothetical protein
MAAYPPDSSIILVAIMPRPRDLEIARLLGWYRIPLRSAPKVVAVEYVAFYQTAAFGAEHRWRIEYYAEVRGHELTTRRELFRDQVNHARAGEEYYKIQVGPVESLPEPVEAGKWRRFTFLYTTGALLRSANQMGDLVVRSEERDVLWRSLRERAMRASQYQAELLPEIPLDPLLLTMLGDLVRL